MIVRAALDQALQRELVGRNVARAARTRRPGMSAAAAERFAALVADESRYTSTGSTAANDLL